MTIEVSNLTKSYGSKKVVDGASFTVQDGMITGFLGPNGAGKSTTLRMLVGLDYSDQGTVLFDGKTYQDLETPFKSIGTLLDAKWVHPNRTAINHLKWLAELNGVSKNRVSEVLAQVGLESVGKKKAGSFSLGMAQRLGLATALLGDPKTLILDEPVNGLDPEGIVWIREFLRYLANEGRTIFVSSHLLTEMSLMADRVVVIGQGKILADSTIKEFTNLAQQNSIVRTSDNARLANILINEHKISVQPRDANRLNVGISDSDFIGKVAFEKQIEVYELYVENSSLESVFVNLTSSQTEYRGGA